MHLCTEGVPDVGGKFGESGDVLLGSLFGPMSFHPRRELAVKLDEEGEGKLRDHGFFA